MRVLLGTGILYSMNQEGVGVDFMRSSEVAYVLFVGCGVYDCT
jgi:hypothetical protein